MVRSLKNVVSLRAALIGCGLCALLMAFMGYGLFPAVFTSAAVLMIVPVLILLVTMIAGLYPAWICAGISLIALFSTGGFPLMLAGTAFLLPFTAVLTMCIRQERAFWKTLMCVAGTLMITTLLIYLVLQFATGGKLYVTAAGYAAQSVFDSSYRDAFLVSLYNMGFFSMDETTLKNAIELVGGTYRLNNAAATELINQLYSYILVYLEGIVPSLLISGNMTNAVLGLGFGIFFGQRAHYRRSYKHPERTEEVTDLKMPPLSQWYIPGNFGKYGAVLAAGYLLMNIVQSGPLYLTGALMWQVFLVFFGLQGLASFNWSQRQRGTAKGWRVAAVIAAMIVPLAQTVFAINGLFDQWKDPRGLRHINESKTKQ